MIASFVKGKDVFDVLPTLFGKSLCYACPPVLCLSSFLLLKYNVQRVRFELLVSKASDELMECLSGDEITNSELYVQLVGDRVRALGGSVKDRRLRIARST